MSEQNERQTAALVLRMAALGAKTTAELIPDPTAKIVSLTSFGLLELVATLVEKVGVSKAEDVLKELAEHPATPITDDELAADVERVKREFGITSSPPPNPYEEG